MKPTKEQFEDFMVIRNSGVTNMFDVDRVCELSTTGIDRSICFYIINYFIELAAEYEVEI